ncbi:MAG: hypothetical protein QG665_415 [Patescibacteria group bacterium]|nr:hypothetical protein [Patescibacteria group bacterium]
MKLLIISQKADKNDQVLGFFHRWVEEFAKNCEEVKFVCLEQGEISLPANVQIFSLGKNIYWQKSKWAKFLGKIVATVRFYFIIFSQVKNYEAIFVHMNPEYIILGGWWWKLTGKKICMWYAHGQVNWRLRLATFWADIVFTSTEQGFRLKSGKKHVVGQGIDTNFFPFCQRVKGEDPQLVAVGRLAPAKNCHFLVDVTKQLKNKYPNIKLIFVGEAVTTTDVGYKADLIDYIKKEGLEEQVKLVGTRGQEGVLEFLSRADIMLSASTNGSLDKTIVEALATGLPVVTSNEAAREILLSRFDIGLYQAGNIEEASICLDNIFKLSQTDYLALGQELRQLVLANHSLDKLIADKILPLLFYATRGDKK